MAGCRAFRIATVAFGLTVVCAGTGAGQAAPLRKTDLVRLLTNPSLTKAQVAGRIRGACLAFDPSGRDRADLQALGADATVMAQIDDCVRRKAAAAARPAAQPPAAQPRPTPATRAPAAAAGGLRIAALQSSVSAGAGTEAVFQVQVTRGGRAVPGLALALRGEDRRALTDARGVATFRVPAGTTVGVRRVAVVAVGDERAAGAPEVEIATRPGPPAAAEVMPLRLELRPGEPAARRQVTVIVRDGYGNPVPGELVEFRPVTPGMGVNGFSSQTNGAGVLSVTFLTTSVRRNGEIELLVRGASVASLSVVVGPAVLSEARTRFVAGEGQRGAAGQRLEQPLVLEVRDTEGVPVPGETVHFAATNGEVTPASAATDAKGQISATVTLGRQAGTTRVAAGVGSLRKEATFPVTPGPAAALVIRQDTVPVRGSLAVRSRQPVLLRVAARDTFGNEVPASGLRASVRGEGVLRVAQVQAEGATGTVELHPRATGSAQIDLEAAGLRETLTAQVLLPLAGGGWMLALRGGWTAFEYVYDPTAQGHPGFLGEVIVGRGLGAGFALAVAATVAGVKASTGSAPSPVSLVDGSLRLEYSVKPRAKVTPVVLLGGGLFQTRSADLQYYDIRHSSYFWLAGAGLNFKLRERLAIELRVTTHQLIEATTSGRKGQMGSLFALTAGIRLGN